MSDRLKTEYYALIEGENVFVSVQEDWQSNYGGYFSLFYKS